MTNDPHISPVRTSSHRVYGCTNPYTVDTRTHPKSFGFVWRSGVTKQTEIIVLMTSPYGPIALTKQQIRDARAAADEIAGGCLLIDSESFTRDTAQPIRFLGPSETGRLFGVEPTWLLKRARENRIPHLRIGKYVRFDPAEIRAFFRKTTDRHANSEETDPQQHSDSKR